MTDQQARLEEAEKEYLENCDWRAFLYEDKTGMPEEIQVRRSSSIPANIARGFKAGAAWMKADLEANSDLTTAYLVGYSKGKADEAKRVSLLADALDNILNAGNMAAQGNWNATDEMKQIAYEALRSFAEGES